MVTNTVNIGQIKARRARGQKALELEPGLAHDPLSLGSARAAPTSNHHTLRLLSLKNNKYVEAAMLRVARRLSRVSELLNLKRHRE